MITRFLGTLLLIISMPLSITASVQVTSTLFELHPTAEELQKCTLIDANHDGNTITSYYQVSGDNVFDWPIYYLNARNGNPADEWLITPAVRFSEPGFLHNISIEARCGGTYIAEAFEVCIGKEPKPEAMTIKAIDNEALLNTEFEKIEGNFVVPESGDYYVGIHIKSNSNAWRIMLRDLRVGVTAITSDVPAAATVVSALTENEGGQYYVDVVFKMPTMSLNGASLATDKNVEVEARTASDAVKAYGLPGSEQTLRLKGASNVESVTLVSIRDGFEGGSVTASATPKYDIPVDPVVTYKVSDDNMQIHLKWEPVTQGFYGGTIDPAQVTYNLYQYQEVETEESVTGGFFPIKTGIQGTEYTYTVAPGTPQNRVDLLLSAKSPGGESEGAMSCLIVETVGELNALPFDENAASFDIKYSGYSSEVYETEYQNAMVGFSNAAKLVEAAGNVGAFCIITNNEEGAMARANFPKISFADASHACLTLKVWTDPYTAPLDIILKGSDGTSAVLGHVQASNASKWIDYNFAIPESFDGKPWAYICLDGKLASYSHHFLTSRIYVRNLVERELALASVSPVYPVLGEEATIKATVENLGFGSIAAPKVKATLLDGSREITAVDLTPESQIIERASTIAYTGAMKFESADLLGRDLTIKVEIVDAADAISENDAMEIDVTVEDSPYPVITDLSGEDSGNAVALSWTNPIKEQVVEGFEKLRHGDQSATLAGWKNVDFDGKDVWGVENFDIPGSLAPKAFQVISSRALGDDFHVPYEGDKYLMAFCPIDENAAADDWFISPEIVAADGLSFQLSTLSSGFTEVVEVMASSTDSDFDSFKVLKTVQKSAPGWEEVAVELPAGTKYVAIHYASKNQFGILIDNLCYTPVKPEYTLVGYNIYRDGVRLNNSPLAAEGYSDATAGYDKATYHVALVVDHHGQVIETPLSNSFSINNSEVEDVDMNHGTVSTEQGTLILNGFEPGTPYAVYTLDGRAIRTGQVSEGPVTIPLQPGFYILRTPATAHKLQIP